LPVRALSEPTRRSGVLPTLSQREEIRGAMGAVT
jgi:hypothetical protein